jgi:hypothetical protein
LFNFYNTNKMKNETALVVKELVMTTYKSNLSKFSESESIELTEINSGIREFIIDLSKDGKVWRGEVNGVMITDGDFWALPKLAMLEECWLYIGRQLQLI